jgi:hypothetical protein
MSLAFISCPYLTKYSLGVAEFFTRNLEIKLSKFRDFNSFFVYGHSLID